MGVVIYFAILLLIVVIGARMQKPFFYQEKVILVLFAIFWPVMLFGWSLTNFCVTVVDLVTGEAFERR